MRYLPVLFALLTPALAGSEQTDRQAFDQPLPQMDQSQGLDFEIGRALFARPWVSAPASTKSSDGLGPLFNARSCTGCHPRAGRGNDAIGLVLHLSDADGRAPMGQYGHQLQDRAVAGMKAEGSVEVSFTQSKQTLNGGEDVTLRRPSYRITGAAYGELPQDHSISPRMAPPMIGMGLLEAIDADDILAFADPDDTDGDGISGRPNYIWREGWELGRFGLKANRIDLIEQITTAFAQDMGLGTQEIPDHWGDCTSLQTECRMAPNGNDGSGKGVEIGVEIMELVTLYTRHLTVPPRRNADRPHTLAGELVFAQAGCRDCHRASFVTRESDAPALSGREIFPYTDLLLHDMGPDLADNRPDWAATGSEWRTAPLWGLGLSQTVNPGSGYLHDGRARTILEAIMWHGGEARPAKDYVKSLPPTDRAALISFLESL